MAAEAEAKQHWKQKEFICICMCTQGLQFSSGLLNVGGEAGGQLIIFDSFVWGVGSSLSQTREHAPFFRSHWTDLI